jgi:hypothetical protein
VTGSAYDTRDRLLELADLWPELNNALGGLKGVVYDDMPKPASRERQLPINANISDLLAEIRDWAAFLARTLLIEGPVDQVALDTAGMCRALARNAEWLTQHPDLGDHIGHEAAEWVTKARRQLDPLKRTRVHNGTCWEPTCGAPLHATINGADSELTCTNKHTLPPHQWIIWARRPEVTT